MNIILLITVCDLNKNRVLNQIENLNNLYKSTVKFIPVFSCNMEYIRNYDVIKVDTTIDSYNNLYKKLFLSFEYIDKHYNYDFICKLDDDTLINFDRFDENVLIGNDYIGQMLNGKGDSTITIDLYFYDIHKSIPITDDFFAKSDFTFAKGNCYFLSKSAVSEILKHRTFIDNLDGKKRINEDRLFGYLLQKNPNIKKKDISLTDEFTVENLLQVTVNYFSIHPIHESIYKSLISKTIDEQKVIIEKYKSVNLLSRKILLHELENRIQSTVINFVNDKRSIGIG